MTREKAVVASLIALALVGGAVAMIVVNKKKTSTDSGDDDNKNITTNAQEMLPMSKTSAELPGQYQFGIYVTRSGPKTKIRLTNRSDCTRDTDMVILIDDDKIEALQYNGGNYQSMGSDSWNVPQDATLHIQVDNGELLITWMSTNGPINVLSALPSVLLSNKMAGPYKFITVEGGRIGS
jgi:hypothetical protein